MPDLAKRDFRQAAFALAAGCLLLLVESTLLIHTRWVEDENWLANGAWTLVQEGRFRMPIFPSDPRFYADISDPAHHLAMAAAFDLFGLGIPQARLVSAAAGLATLLVVFLLAMEIGGPACAMLATLLAATDTFLVVASRTARPEAITALLCWLGLLFYYYAATRKSGKLALAAGLALGVSCVNHPLTLPFVLSIGIFLLASFGWTVFRQRIFWSFALGLLLPAALYLMWCFSDAAHIACFRNVYFSKTGDPMLGRIVGEVNRWKDFIGLASQRVSTGVRVPVRVHIAIILVAAFGYLFRIRRDLAVPAGILFSMNLLWWIYLVNKGPRYLAILAPLFALVLGWVGAQSLRRPWRWMALATFSLVMITQLGGNAYWLYQSRNADYPTLAASLRQIVPEKASAYGATTFWLALHDRTYYAFDRTKWEFAARNLKPEYLIMNDRVMLHGSGQGEDDFAVLRSELNAFVQQHGTLVGRVPGKFYGDLEVYRVSYGDRASENHNSTAGSR